MLADGHHAAANGNGFSHIAIQEQLNGKVVKRVEKPVMNNIEAKLYLPSFQLWPNNLEIQLRRYGCILH